MSGGSYNYAYFQAEEMAASMQRQPEPILQAFGKHLEEVAKVMYAYEWYSSADWGKDQMLEVVKEHLPTISLDTRHELTKLRDGLTELLDTIGEESDDR